MSIKFPLLEAKDIEVKVKQVSAKGAIALLYKTARVDMACLDDVVGAECWEDDYKEIGGVLYCGIGIHTDKGVRWKWSNGVESRSDGDGNEKKGEASDAFKRAGFMWGIGRELYTAPFIFLNVETEQDGNDGKKYKLKDRFSTFSVKSITYDKDDTIDKVVIENNQNEIVYPKNYNNAPKPQPKADPKPLPQPKKEVGTELLTTPTFALTESEYAAYLMAKIKDSKVKPSFVTAQITKYGKQKAAELEWEEFKTIVSTIETELAK